MTDKDPRVTDLTPIAKNVTDIPTAPIIYFDNAPLRGGADVFNIALSCVRLCMTDGDVQAAQVVVAHLRCNREAALSLKSALDFLLEQPPAEVPQGPAH